MKRLLAYLLIILSFSFVTITNTYAKPVTIASQRGLHRNAKIRSRYQKKRPGLNTVVDYSGGLSEIRAQKNLEKLNGI